VNLALGERDALLRDFYRKQEFDLLTTPKGPLETEQGSVFDAGRDGNGEDQDIPACVKPNIPLCALEGLIGCQGKILDVEIGSIGTETGRTCPAPPENPPLTSESPPESSPSASKSREKSRRKGIAPGIEGGRAETKFSCEKIAAQIVLIPLFHARASIPVIVRLGLSFRHTTPREFYALVRGAEKALVPGTVPGNSDKEAPSFARRPDYTLFIHEIISIVSKYK
jgi:hypothetical protein